MVVKCVELTMKPVRAEQIIGRWWSEPRSAREHFKAKVARKSGARCPKGIETVLNIAKNPCFKATFNIISPIRGDRKKLIHILPSLRD